jgi:glutamine amidotransferase
VSVIRPVALFDGVPVPSDFYFVHSYHLVPLYDHDTVARTPYCGGFVSAVVRDNVAGVQFHPEKSMKSGLRVIRNFLGA